MRKFIFSGIIVGLVAAFLVVSLHQVRAQERLTGAREATSAVTKVSGVSVVRVHLTGSARLAGGIADVKFKEDLAPDIKVIVTPVGSWSGIYVVNVSKGGFTARAGTGDPSAEFNWLAVGESRVRKATPQSQIGKVD